MAFVEVAANSASDEYAIDNSAVFYGGAYMTRTSETPTNEDMVTISVWLKRSCNFGASQTIISWNSGNGSQAYIRFANGDDKVQFFNNTAGETNTSIITNSVVRDPAAWYHLVLQYDAAQGTDSNRVKIYLNNVLQTLGTDDYPPQNTALALNVGSRTINIGRWAAGSEYYEGYMADFHYLDGVIKDPDDFGKANDNGVWVPKKYTGGSYGNNGFFLEFQQTGTSANSSGIGADTSGVDNHWGVTDMNAHAINVDTPTLNYCTLNEIGATDSQGATGNIENGALRLPTGHKAQGLTMDNSMLDGGKWYFEVYLATSSSLNTTLGFRNSFNGDDTPSIEQENDGQIKKDGSNVGSTDTAFGNGNVIGILLDWSTATRKIIFEHNNSAHSEGEQTFSASVEGYHYHGRETGSGAVQLYNFGNTPAFFGNKTAGDNADEDGYGNFIYAVPSGYYAINSKNLAEHG